LRFPHREQFILKGAMLLTAWGFGDAVRPTEITFPSLLEFPQPKLRAYSRENSIAEKFEAMTKLGMANTRMKDYFDLWHLARTFAFDGIELAETIRATFERRAAVLPNTAPTGLSDEFAQDKVKRTQWRAFWKKAVRREPMPELPEVVAAISGFLLPAITAANRPAGFPQKWPVGGPWRAT
jgi:hypothetical protein